MCWTAYLTLHAIDSFSPTFCVQNMVYYKLSHVDHRISNPEQRIASDIPKFCSELSGLVQDDLTAVADGLIYIWRLCSYASPKYVLWILVINSPTPPQCMHACTLQHTQSKGLLRFVKYNMTTSPAFSRQKRKWNILWQWLKSSTPSLRKLCCLNVCLIYIMTTSLLIII